MSRVRPGLYIGNSLNVMAEMPESSVDAIVTDPPYGLGFMGQKWDTYARETNRRPAARATFDHTGGNHNPSNSADASRTRRLEGQRFQDAAYTWAVAMLRIAKPGAHLVAFGGTRTYHRLAVAIEDAGWEIRDCLSWLYGSGFPKSHNGPWGGTALKPAWEPIILARKPLVGTVAANVTAHGTGALNIDGCRIGTDDTRGKASRTALGVMNDDAWEPREVVAGSASGRWPANVVLDEEAARLLDEQSGTMKGTHAGSFQREMTSRGYDGGGLGQRKAADHAPVEIAKPGYGDAGGASRFFYTAKASRSERDAGLPEGMTNDHPTVKPIALMRWLARLVTPPGGIVVDPFAGSFTTGCACALEGFPFAGIDREARHVEIGRYRVAHWRDVADRERRAREEATAQHSLLPDEPIA